MALEQTPDARETVIYAIGDVHGEAERLRSLHELILERHRKSHDQYICKIVHLGDYVDRGPDSAGVIEQLLKLNAREDIELVALRGNHEEMMLDGLAKATPSALSNWLVNGGEETLNSYRRAGHKGVCPSHIAFLETCPNLHIEAKRNLLFVHAGVDPATYPNDVPATYLWTRSRRFFDVEKWHNPALDGWTVVHGHTPTKDFMPDDISGAGRRINLDTGAVFGGRLTAGIFAPGEDVKFIYA